MAHRPESTLEQSGPTRSALGQIIHNRDVPDAAEPNLPFRWDLVTPDHLGSLLVGTQEPDLWFLDALVETAARVVARSGGGDLVFVGRSPDSMFDLLGGVLANTPLGQGVSRLPISFQRLPTQVSPGKWRLGPLPAPERAAARQMLASLGLTPHQLARRARPVAFVDVVGHGSTFTQVFGLLRDWIDEERGPWVTIRKKVRFVGVTIRGKTSPNAYRWQQHAEWTGQLPAASIVNVSLDLAAWAYFGNDQTKMNRTFRPDDWLAEAPGVDRDEQTRQALAEAVALVTYGRSVQGRRAFARATAGEPGLAQSWRRSLVTQLNPAG
jgi:hypothetical protein